MRRLSVLFFALLYSPVVSIHAQGASIVSPTFLQAPGEIDTSYLITEAPASSNGTYDRLHQISTLHHSYYSACDSTIDLIVGDRSGFNHQDMRTA